MVVVISEPTVLTQHDGREERTAKRLCVTNVTGLLTLLCSGLLQKDLLKGR